MGFEMSDIIEDRSDLDELLIYLSTIFLIIFGIILLSFCLKLALWIYIGNFYPDHLRERESRISTWSRSDPSRTNIYTITDAHVRSPPAYNNDIILVESGIDQNRNVTTLVAKDDANLPTYEEVIAADNSAIAGPATSSTNAENVMLPAPPYSAVDPYKASVANGNPT